MSLENRIDKQKLGIYSINQKRWGTKREDSMHEIKNDFLGVLLLSLSFAALKMSLVSCVVEFVISG